MGYFQTKNACYFALENYASEQYKNPEISSILTEGLTHLPSAITTNTEFDSLRDDGVLHVNKLRKAGVKV